MVYYMEYCVTISPDPKKKIDKKEYQAMAPRKQYQALVYRIANICRSHRLIKSYKFIFEISSSGNIHSHGSIMVEQKENNLHALHIKSFQQQIAETFGRSVNKQFFIDVCCKIKIRDDSIVSDKYATWEDYLKKEQKGLPSWMRSIDSTNIVEMREADDEEQIRRADAKENTGICLDLD